MLQTRCPGLVARGLVNCCRTLALCALLVPYIATPQAVATSTQWRPDTPLGAHAMLYLDAPYGFKRAMFQQTAGLGASSIRVDLALTAIFTADGAEHWQQVDEVMALAREYRVRPVGVLLATPLFIARDSYKSPPADLDAWKRMVSQVVAHTHDVVETFEILNEPDGRWAFTGSPGDYAKLLRAGHDAIKAANPHARVAIAGTMGLASRRWLDEVLAQAGPHSERLYDIANVHIRASLRRLPEVVHAWHRFYAAHHAGDKPLWVTEFGYPSDPGYQYDSAYRAGPESQAAYLCRALPVLLRCGATKVFVTLRDNLGGQFASEGVIAGSVGDPAPADPEVVHKPAFAALSRLAGSLREG
jgi:hypothetical protein